MELPQHKKLYELLRRHILDELYKPGDLLPSENELSQLHGIARPTVRKALDQLVSDGFILKHQGKGSLVKGSPKGIGILALSSTTSALKGENLSTQIIVQPEIRPWNDAFGFEITQADKEVGCIYFERLRLMDEKPVFFDITLLPNNGIPRFTSINMENRSLFDMLRSKYQITVTGGTQQIFAIKANKRLQTYFGIKAGHPILQLNRRIETSRPGFILYSQIFCITDQYGLVGSF